MTRPNSLFSYIQLYKYLRWNFYRFHLSYFILTIILSSVIVYGSGVNGNSNDAEAEFRLRYIDALFLCTSAMTNAGLNTVNLGSLTAFQQAVLGILILVEIVVTVSVATVWIRRYFFKKHVHHFVRQSPAGRQLVEEIGRERGVPITSSSRETKVTKNTSIRHRSAKPEQDSSLLSKAIVRISHHEIGHGRFPYPWDTKAFHSMKSKFRYHTQQLRVSYRHYLSFEPFLDSKVALVSRIPCTKTVLHC